MSQRRNMRSYTRPRATGGSGGGGGGDGGVPPRTVCTERRERNYRASAFVAFSSICSERARATAIITTNKTTFVYNFVFPYGNHSTIDVYVNRTYVIDAR